MDEGAIKTLFLPFENGDLSLPQYDARWLFLNAEIPPVSDQCWQENLDCIQGFRPSFLALQQSGFRVTPLAESSEHAGALVLLGKHRELNRRNIFTAMERTLPGAPILISGAKTSGVQAMRKEMSDLVTIEQSLSKNHAQVFCFKRPEHWVSPVSGHASTIVSGELTFETAPGMFSHKAVDSGSELLAKHFDKITGKVADLGAGWGYLSAALLQKCPAVTAVDLFEADHASLEAARYNLQKLSPMLTIGFHWVDLLQEPVQGPYDAVIMNPPFHLGRSTDASIGQRMIAIASKALKPGGRLMMVANKELPYEDTLQRAFRKFERVDENRQYKVIRAMK